MQSTLLTAAATIVFGMLNPPAHALALTGSGLRSEMWLGPYVVDSFTTQLKFDLMKSPTGDSYAYFEIKTDLAVPIEETEEKYIYNQVCFEHLCFLWTHYWDEESATVIHEVLGCHSFEDGVCSTWDEDHESLVTLTLASGSNSWEKSVHTLESAYFPTDNIIEGLPTNFNGESLTYSIEIPLSVFTYYDIALQSGLTGSHFVYAVGSEAQAEFSFDLDLSTVDSHETKEEDEVTEAAEASLIVIYNDKGCKGTPYPVTLDIGESEKTVTSEDLLSAFKCRQWNTRCAQSIWMSPDVVVTLNWAHDDPLLAATLRRNYSCQENLDMQEYAFNSLVVSRVDEE